MTARPVKPINYLAYGANDILGAGSMAVISGWILYFYTTFCGLSATQAAAIFAIARLLDAIVSPLVGHLSDNFYRTALGRRFGRRRFFLLICIPLVPSFALMWVGGQSFWYYLATYVLFETIYAVVLIPYETLAAEMTKDYKIKAKLAGIRILCAQSSAIAAGFLPAAIIGWVGGKDSADTFFIMGVIFAVTFAIVLSFTWAFTFERSVAEVEQLKAGEPVQSLGDSFKTLYANLFSTLKIRAFRLHLGMYLGGYISQDVFNAVFTYFIVFAMGSSVAVASSMLGSMYIVQLFAVALFIQLCLRFHPAPSYRVAVCFYILGVVGFLLLDAVKPENLALWLFVPVALSGMGRGGLNYIPWNTYNYMADVDEVVTGKRREGIFAGVMTFIRKATQAAAVMGVGLILEAGGFLPKAEVQSDAAINTILLVMGIGTIVVLCGGFLVSLRFKLDGPRHAILMEEIARFKQGRMETTPDRKAILEDLTGWRYETLWGRGRR
ncbi:MULTISPECIES: MFS transporter [unclassified Azospirillum]|uniref:MFS transporter n=1 Tax=unclassified Azospirillum TaxID=2630922 RepID=UPI000B6CBF62|nr:MULTISPECIES: MFS transporter [unclassified Azospirillum]SNS47463.1 oligogalacturonide transporter [Azospirillum sp. RU38E]SNS66602.1 oligogalacturonide transporter [Azospirillum sp. RU37A]